MVKINVHRKKIKSYFINLTLKIKLNIDSSFNDLDKRFSQLEKCTDCTGLL